MSLELPEHLAPLQLVSIERAVLETLAYSDLFDFPLRIEELHRYLPLPAGLTDLTDTLINNTGLFEKCDGYYFLPGRRALIALRRQREEASRLAFRRAVRFGNLLGALPFIRMVGLTGSLALLNCDRDADIDYFLVAAQGRLWMARAFALLVGRVAAVMGNTLCPNLIISDRVLEWQQQDLYSAHELCQMVPIAGTWVYARLRQANLWTTTFLPNASGAPPLSPKASPAFPLAQDLGEIPLRGRLGDRLEAWEINRKIKRFTVQAGYGVETTFNADICQGNFDHHGLQTMESYWQRLAGLGL